MKKVCQLFAILAVVGLVGSAMAADAGDKPKPDFRGKITKVDTDAKKVTFKTGMGDDAKEVTVLVDATTKISLDGADAKLADLKADMFVGVFGQADKVATKINAFTKMPGGGHGKGGGGGGGN